MPPENFGENDSSEVVQQDETIDEPSLWESMGEWAAEAQQEIQYATGIIEGTELAYTYLDKGPTDDEVRDIAKIAGETTDPQLIIDLMITIGDPPNPRTEEIILTNARRCERQPNGQNEDMYRTINQTSRRMAVINFNRFMEESGSGDHDTFAPSYIAGLPDETAHDPGDPDLPYNYNYAERAYDENPEAYARSFPGSREVTGEEHPEVFAKIASHASGQSPSRAAGYTGMNDTGNANPLNNPNLTLDQRTALGDAIVSINFEPKNAANPEECNALDNLMYKVASRPRGTTPDTLRQMIQKFYSPENREGYITPRTADALVNRINKMAENERLDMGTHKDLYSTLKKATRFLPPQMKGHQIPKPYREANA
jgi:hypothetical protein